MADILVLGATGYCGRLAALYLSHHPQRSSFTLAIAGRSRSKLEAIKEELDPDVTIYEVDVNNFEEVERIVKQVKVVANMVGPYWRYSTPVVRACARNGVHHVDITGERPWIHKIIHEFDYLARQTGAIIVPSCGLDSVPSDAIVFLANKTLKTLVGPDAEIEDSVTAVKLKGGIAGGTLATTIALMEEVPKNVREMSSRGYSLSPIVGVPTTGYQLLYKLPSFPSSKPIYGSIFPLSAGNRAIVTRTWGLQQFHAFHSGLPESERVGDKMLTYGSKFQYDEFLRARGKAGAFVTSLSMAVVGICLMMFSPVRWLFKRVVTQPGQGPSAKSLKHGYMEYLNITTSVAPPGSQPTRIRTIIRGNGDPGTWLTAIMLGESALSLLLDTDRLPALAKLGGVLTPMTALGDVLIERLKATKVFEFESEVVLEGEAESEGRKTR